MGLSSSYAHGEEREGEGVRDVLSWLQSPHNAQGFVGEGATTGHHARGDQPLDFSPLGAPQQRSSLPHSHTIHHLMREGGVEHTLDFTPLKGEVGAQQQPGFLPPHTTQDLVGEGGVLHPHSTQHLMGEKEGEHHTLDFTPSQGEADTQHTLVKMELELEGAVQGESLSADTTAAITMAQNTPLLLHNLLALPTLPHFPLSSSFPLGLTPSVAGFPLTLPQMATTGGGGGVPVSRHSSDGSRAHTPSLPGQREPKLKVGVLAGYNGVLRGMSAIFYQCYIECEGGVCVCA